VDQGFDYSFNLPSGIQHSPYAYFENNDWYPLSIDSVIEHVRTTVGDGIEVRPVGEMRSEPSRFSSVESEAWEVMSRSISETFPEASVAPWILTGATDSRYYEDFAGDIYGFAPFTGDMESLGTIHSTGERIRTSDAERAVSFFCRLIRNAQPAD
jgi:carboxypeptidase PM20D1